MHIYIRVFGTQYCHNTLYYYVFNKPITSEDTDKAHQIGTAYLVEHKRCNALTALDPFCIDVKEQRYHHWEGRDGGQIVSPGEACRSAQARGAEGMEEVECAYVCELYHLKCTKHTACYYHWSLIN